VGRDCEGRRPDAAKAERLDLGDRYVAELDSPDEFSCGFGYEDGLIVQRRDEKPWTVLPQDERPRRRD
jgi:hypothetical protein